MVEHISQEIHNAAKIIWEYMVLKDQIIEADIIIGLGCSDIDIAVKAAQLYRDGYAKKVLFTGFGHTTIPSNMISEAEMFYHVARKYGVPDEDIILERRASNTGENIRFSYDLLKKLDMLPKKILAVQKPFMQRRTFVTIMKQWPEKLDSVQVTSRIEDYDLYMRDQDKGRLIHILVGDFYRIKAYPELGYQIPQEIPDHVWPAFDILVEAGYTDYLSGEIWPPQK